MPRGPGKNMKAHLEGRAKCWCCKPPQLGGFRLNPDAAEMPEGVGTCQNKTADDDDDGT